MPNPKRRHSKPRRNTRRANWKLESKSLGLCSQCRQAKLPHRVCPNCGHYDGKEIVAADEA
jgi:large subunit ribosomal protein L32